MSPKTLLSAYGWAFWNATELRHQMDQGLNYPSYYRTYPEQIARYERLMQRIERRLIRGEHAP